MIDSFLVSTLLAGIGVAFASAPLGCFVVWRRMSYFGDATAHATILGVALALSFSQSIFIGALAVALIMAFTVNVLSGRGYAMDTLLGVLSHSALAIGLVSISLVKSVRIDLMGYLVGDILAVSNFDLILIWLCAIMVMLFIWWRWSKLLTATISTELAYAAGINPQREQLVLTLLLALVVAVAIKIVGVLLIAAMLIIPAATARYFSNTPERMVQFSGMISIFSVIGGLWTSYEFDTPTGPSIVCIAALFFVVANIRGLLIR